MENRRGGLVSKEERIQIIEMIKEACDAGARQQAACNILGVSSRTIQRWKKEGTMEDRRRTIQKIPHNKLTAEETEKMLCRVNQPEYEDLSPAIIVPLLADRGEYLGSESTMYRVLKREHQLSHRMTSKPRNTYRPEAIIATRPNQVYSWDITYLASTTRGVFFYLYLIMDIYSRKIVGWQVYEKESAEYAADVVEAACYDEGIQKDQVILHSDNGSPMKGATMLATLQRLGVIPSFSRPSVSNDNPYSEALFRTLKYTPMYPAHPFSTLHSARDWVKSFVKWYNHAHLHSAIKFVTPVQRHEGKDEGILKKRKEVYLQAKNRHPHRWTRKTRDWSKNKEVLLNPEKCKSKALKPETAA